MEDIKFKLLLKDDNFIVYEIYLKYRKHYVGKVYFLKKNDEVIVKYNFENSEFYSMVGMIMLNDILNIGLRDFNDVKLSKINTKKQISYVDYYLDCFKVIKDEDENGVSYILRK